MKHTKGPWVVKRIHATEFHIDEAGQCVLTNEANAQLIAAAPDMLEALELVAESEIGKELKFRVIDAVLSAIKKARGIK